MKRLLVLVAATYLLTISTLVICRYINGDRLLSVQTSSMAPTFRPSDAIIVHKTSLTELQIGDIVSYRSPADNRVVVSHRLTSIDYETGRLITQGDALDLQDLPIPSRLVIGKVYKIVPRVGGWIDWLHKPTGLIVAVYVPATIVLLYEVRRFSRKTSEPHYRLYGYR